MIERQDVEHVARLARLAMDEVELERMRQELAGILAYVDRLRQVDTAGVEPTSHAVPLVNVMRDDEVAPGLAPEAALSNAPDRRDGMFRVPRILEDG